MKGLQYVLLLITALLITTSSGCGSANTVSEVSVNESGIDVIERTTVFDGTAWPSWRGPHRNGAAVDQPLPSTWSESTGILWRVETPGRGHCSPIVFGNSVYLTTAIITQQIQQIMAFDGHSGERQWTTVLHDGGLPSERQLHSKSSHANATITCDGEHLYMAFLNTDRIIASAVGLTGNLVWQKELGQFVSVFGYAPSPVLYKSLVIFAADNPGGGWLAAVDSTTGKIAWRVARGHMTSHSSPTVAHVGDRDQLLISGCDAVTSYDPASGNELWRTPCIAEATCGTIVTTSELIFASGGYPEKETICLSAEGKQVWSNRTQIYEPSLVVIRDQVIAVSDDGIAYCWSAQTGETIWRKRLRGSFSASPLVCNNRVYVPNLSGDTFVFSTTNGQFTLIAQNKIGDDCYASPAAADGRLFLRIGVGTTPNRGEQLVCLGTSISDTIGE